MAGLAGRPAGHPEPRAEGDVERGLELVRARLDDDLDTPGALAALDAEARRGVPSAVGAALLGVTL